MPILQIWKLRPREVTRLGMNQIAAWEEGGSPVSHFPLFVPPCWCLTSAHKHTQVPHLNTKLSLHLVHNTLLLIWEFFPFATNCLERETQFPFLLSQLLSLIIGKLPTPPQQHTIKNIPFSQLSIKEET